MLWYFSIMFTERDLKIYKKVIWSRKSRRQWQNKKDTNNDGQNTTQKTTDWTTRT